ncbi:MAG TPA: M20/M25/M40 family metallo-hydrolase [Bryobacteraceae bacterium]|nr:M20/M25/M40 family metallo-hydrolase [Bryobacteraceae bacterium]HOQ47028.1 M20/M25/M40 family metallo-hydrolase [Bryobacteraceae bacterium]HPU71099.1 M20/M25/M40 family metallo-hydrolase [Bryobacteraceae bacterium]
MNLIELTRALVDIESITNNEKQVGEFLLERVSELAARTGGTAEAIPVEPGRDNVFACWGTPVATLSTHMDVVPPFFPSREDEDFIYGRGACDAKGIIAAMIGAAERLLAEGTRNFALLFVVGEERNSAGAYAAARNGRGSRYLINGEPTDNKLALGSKGALRYELIARGRMAHSAYPELGESAIDKLLDALAEIRSFPLPEDPVLGRGTLNIGTISGGRAPNVIPDEARAEIMFRLTGDAEPVRAAVAKAAAGRVEAIERICIPAVRLTPFEDLPTTVVAFTTDIPAFGGSWGQPFLIGPGSIHVAHTVDEKIPKRQLFEAVEIYTRMVRRLVTSR